MDQQAAFDDTVCGYCRAPLSDHRDETAFRICLHRLTGEKRDLAEKVLRVVEREERGCFGEGATGISSAVRDLFVESGIEVERKGP